MSAGDFERVWVNQPALQRLGAAMGYVMWAFLFEWYRARCTDNLLPESIVKLFVRWEMLHADPHIGYRVLGTDV